MLDKQWLEKPMADELEFEQEANEPVIEIAGYWKLRGKEEKLIYVYK
jgi:hypothetical protein